MALETLKGIEHIGGFEVVVMDKLRESNPELFPKEALGQMNYEAFERDIRPHKFIYVRHDKNSITFNIQNGPIKEVGINGCQVDTLIDTATLILLGLNEKFPCEENTAAINCLMRASQFLEERKINREKRGVEGLDKP
jgi:hypothetical protein